MNATPHPVIHPSAAIQAGVAQRDITPPVGIYARSWGAAIHDAAEGLHRPLTATVLAMREGPAAPPVLLIGADLGWWQRNEDEWLVRSALLKRFDLPAERVMICAAHTHAGPSICPAAAAKPGGEMVEPYLHSIRNLLIDAVEEAIDGLKPAVLTWNTGRCDLATNRDLPDPAGGRVVCGYNPDTPADDALLVGRVSDSQGRTFATIVNYACHPTTLAWDNRLISPDYIGAMRELVEGHTRAACVFLQGASGELSPREQYTGDAAIADANGRRLGYAVLATLEAMLPPKTALHYTGVVESGAPLATWARRQHQPPTGIAASMIDVPLPLRPLPDEAEIERQLAACADRVMAERLRRKLRVRASVGQGPTIATPAWIWRIGDSVIVGQPNEAYSQFQQALRQRFPELAVAAINLVNGTVGYLAPPELHDLDIYQVWQCPFDRQALEILIEACTAEIQRLAGPRKEDR